MRLLVPRFTAARLVVVKRAVDDTENFEAQHLERRKNTMNTLTSGRRGLRYTVLTAAIAAAALGTIAPAFAHENETRSYPDCPLLVEGDSGDCVARLQHDLNMVNTYYNLPQTGFFGVLTRTAVLDFQGRNGLDADGNVGGETTDVLADQASPEDFVQSPRPGPPLESSEPAPYQAAPPVNPGSEILAERCPPQEYATLDAYLSGEVASPNCFPYQPDIEETKTGRRALDPFTDGCSGRSWEDDAFFDRNDACATHDYGYDLIRFGVDSFGESDVDNYFYEDMLADCEDRIFEAVCVDSAQFYRAGVRFGSAKPGDTISVS